MDIKKIRGFNAKAYKRRLKLFRIAVASNGNEYQIDFAKKLGIDFKRWNNYERGYPVPREVAFIIRNKFGMSIEYLWFGDEGNLSDDWKERLEKAEETLREREEAETTFARAKAKLESVKQRSR
jgi:transcriptional regulator with XRE-family HTH domain